MKNILEKLGEIMVDHPKATKIAFSGIVGAVVLCGMDAIEMIGTVNATKKISSEIDEILKNASEMDECSKDTE